MRERKQVKKVLAVSLCVVLGMGVTACSSKNAVSEIDTEDIVINDTENTGVLDSKPQISESQGNTEEHSEAEVNGIDNSQNPASLFVNANLQGHVVEFSDTEISISMATMKTADDGGEVMVEASPGMENEDELVHVTYADNVSIQTLVMDSASQTQISLSDSEKSSIKKQTNVLVFGSCQDTYHWMADKVVIVRWQ